MTGDFTNSFKAFDKLTSGHIFRLYHSYWYLESGTQKDLFEILDVFDGTVDILEQSIIGDVKGAYKKAKSFAKWLLVNLENKPGRQPDEDHEWSTYG